MIFSHCFLFLRQNRCWKHSSGGEERGSEEQQEGVYTISLSEERDGMYFFKSGHEIRVMLEGSPANVPSQKLRSIVPGLKGCLNAFKFHIYFVKFHACYFIALNSLSAVEAYYHATIHIARTYS